MKYAISLAVWLVALPAVVGAQGIPVIDAQSLIQQTLTAARTLEELNQAREAYQTQLEELRTSLDQLDALTGVTGIGQLLNTAADQAQRRYLPETWEDTLAILEAGGNPASMEDVRRVYAEREASTRIATRDEVGLLGPDDPIAIAHERNRRSTLASDAVAQAAYARSQDRVRQYEFLIDQIERAPTSKTTLDLANRIVGENGLTLNELVRLLATQISAEAAARTDDLVGRTKLEQRFSNYPQKLRTVEARLLGTLE